MTSLYRFPRSRWLYRPSYVTDGNFELNHLKMRRPDDDVALRDGAGHMVTSGLYSQHLNTAQEPKQRSRCSNHKAVNNANAQRHNLDSTGIGGCGCARHGAFVPHCMVDFQKGERYSSYFPRCGNTTTDCNLVQANKYRLFDLQRFELEQISNCIGRV